MSSESNTLQFRPLLGKYSALFLIVLGADFDSTDQSIGYGVVVGIGFFFALIMVFLTYLQSKFTTLSPSSSEEFTSASRSVKPGLVCCGIVSAWTWSATLLQSSTAAYTFGVSGPWWYGVGGTIQLAIFGMVAANVKMNANGAHTFLEIVQVRFGTGPHLLFTFYAFLCIMVVCGSLLSTVNALTGMNIIAACMLLPIGIAVYVLWGGLRATFICDWSHTIILFTIIYIFIFSVLLLAKGIILKAAIASDPKTTTKAYMLGGLSWFAVPFAFASCLGLAARALVNDPRFPTYPAPLSPAQTSAGLTAPAAAAVIMGKGGAVAILLVVFMAVTSALPRTSSSLTDPGDAVHTMWMGCWAVILHKASIDLGWVNRSTIALEIIVTHVLSPNQSCFMSILSPAVIPIALTVSWSKLTRAGVLSGALIGATLGMAAWMIGCWKIYGVINVTNLANPYSAVCSGLTGLLFSGLITVAVSLLSPNDYDFHGTRAIEDLDKAASISPDSPPLAVRGDFSPSQTKEGKVDVETGSIPVEESAPSGKDEPVDIATLRASFKRAAIYSSSLTAIVTIIVPIPMFFSNYVFSVHFFGFWISDMGPYEWYLLRSFAYMGVQGTNSDYRKGMLEGTEVIASALGQKH
ncbi:hypothetical protein CCMSSC00406_0003582 [Pleurotus cornucopiae]|uniref:Uncharacterized protein n=1 Tax=Pleurotus cornucopiae TaxID=5321 RepID=A0ACB7IIY3_PLECO|nr:hypothetical protein CCMSSC00406_0003582 [Pleurotus cornucopiae]